MRGGGNEKTSTPVRGNRCPRFGSASKHTSMQSLVIDGHCTHPGEKLYPHNTCTYIPRTVMPSTTDTGFLLEHRKKMYQQSLVTHACSCTMRGGRSYHITPLSTARPALSHKLPIKYHLRLSFLFKAPATGVFHPQFSRLHIIACSWLPCQFVRGPTDVI